MDDRPYSDAELERYFSDPDARRSAAQTGATSAGGDGSSATPPPAAPPPRTAPSGSDDEIKQRTFLVFKRGLMGLGIVAVLVLAWLLWLSRDLPSLEQIENPKNLLATVVYTSDGEELARYYANENRTWVPLSEISEHVTNALVATEDRDFYDHWGVHMRRTIQAPFLTMAGKTQGGSTITQQLARNLFRLETGFTMGDRSVLRKIKEILTAVRIERIYTKDEILEAYLNTVPFRYNAFGIEAASQTYFDKPAADLKAEEAAVLVGMLAANTRYDPRRNPDNSKRRRNVVLANMVGQGVLDDGYFQQVKDEDIVLTFSPYSHEDNLAPHFAEVLRQWFKDWCETNGYDPYADGLVLHTTINSDMQRLATAAVIEMMDGLQAVVDAEWGQPSAMGLGTMPGPYVRRMERGDIRPFGRWWDRNTRIVDEYIRGTADYRRLTTDGGLSRDAAIERLRGNNEFMDSLRTIKTRIEGSLVAIEPSTGQVRAWVGGRNFVEDKYDHVGLARRQPGSTFKPFAYTAAFDAGYSPNYHVLDAAFTWDGWRPLNFGGSSGGGYTTLRSALANSKNIPTARVTRLVTANNVADLARDLGIRSPLDLTPADASDDDTFPNSIGLGVTDVTLLEMATAYATLANYGVYHGPPDTGNRAYPTPPPYPPQIELAVSRIEDRYGNIIAEFTPYGREVLNPSVAYTTVDVLKDVVSSGTAVGLRSRFDVNGIELAGKTGTTQDAGDGWFMAMNPELVVGAWVGWNDRRIHFRSNYWGQGSHTGLYLVGAFLEKLQNEAPENLRLDPGRKFEPPPNYQPPSRTGYDGPPPQRSDDPNVTSDRPVRDLLRRLREREAQQEESNGNRGRIGW